MKESIRDFNLQRAFQLASFLFPDRKFAIQIVIQSLDKLEIAAQRQIKRLKHEGTRPRTKAVLTDMQLLQRLICHHADQLQRLQEMTASPLPSRAEMVVRWAQQIVMLGESNSFHSTVGICRVLHCYETTGARDVYDLLLQDPGRGKNDDDYRRAKSRIISGLRGRFGDRVRPVRNSQGADGFASIEPISPQLRTLTTECLSRLAVWDVTAPSIPNHVNQSRWVSIPELASDGDDLDAELPIERKRLHTIIHPEPFGRLIRALGLPHPEEMVRIPEFEEDMQNNYTDKFGVTPSKAPELVAEELDGIRKVVMGKTHYDSLLDVPSLSVRVNGVERARIKIAGVKNPTVDLELQPFDRTVEVLALVEQSMRTVAFWFVDRDFRGGLAPGVYDLVLPSGETLSLLVESTGSGDDGAHVTVSLHRPLSLLKTVRDASCRIDQDARDPATKAHLCAPASGS